MKSGAVGKSGYLRLGFEHRDGRTILADLDSRTPFLAQRALHCDDALPDMAWLFMITTGGCVLQGDRLALDVSLGPGARAHVTTQSATKVHSMDANYAHQTQSFTLGEGAYLEFLPDPLIPHRQARFANDTRIVIDPTASLLCSEIVQPGRKHHHPDECFGATLLSLATSATRPGGQPLFSEKLVIEPLRNPMRQSGVMDGFDVFGNVILCTPADVADRVHARVGAEVDLDGRRGLRRLPAAQRRRPHLQGAGPRDRAGAGQGPRVLGGGSPGNHRRRHPAPFLLAVAVATTAFHSRRPMKSLLASWESLCAASGAVRFVDINLRGVGQVMFQDNPLSGALFLAAIAWGSFAAGVPQVLFGGLLAVVAATLHRAVAARRSRHRCTRDSMASMACSSAWRSPRSSRRVRCCGPMWCWAPRCRSSRWRPPPVWPGPGACRR